MFFSEYTGPLTLRYNPKWLAILKSTNSLQSSVERDNHMPGKGYSGGRFDYTPTPEEENVIKKIFNEEYDILKLQSFETTTKVFDPATENIKQMFSVPQPQAQVSP